MKPHIKLTIRRANGHTSTITSADPTAEMLAQAEALMEHLTIGLHPSRRCAACGHPRDNHRLRHPFVEPEEGR